MNESIKDILNILESNGYEAYVVGGYVRDFLLGINSTDIDICTNALPKEIVNIFNNYNLNSSEYGSFKIITNKYSFDITTYRKETKYVNRKPTEIEYISNLIDDLNRRDFTINTFCMNKNGEIIDLLNARKDLNERVIKGIGNPKKRFKEDPLRILRAIRFSTILDFELDNKIIKAIDANKELIKTLSNTRIKYELDKILTSEYALNGLAIIKEFGIDKILNIKWNNIKYVPDICGMYSQLEINDYTFTKSEKYNINAIKDIVNYGKIDNYMLYEFGLYLCIVAGNILNIDTKSINEMYSKMIINSEKDLCISGGEICGILNIDPSDIIKEIKEDIIDKMLSNKLNNNKEDVLKYLKDNYK